MHSRPMGPSPEALAPIAEDSLSAAAMAATNAAPGFSEGASLDSKSLALAVTKKRHGLNPISTGTSERIVLATAQAEIPYKLVGGAEETAPGALQERQQLHGSQLLAQFGLLTEDDMATWTCRAKPRKCCFDEEALVSDGEGWSSDSD